MASVTGTTAELSCVQASYCSRPEHMCRTVRRPSRLEGCANHGPQPNALLLLAALLIGRRSRQVVPIPGMAREVWAVPPLITAVALNPVRHFIELGVRMSNIFWRRRIAMAFKIFPMI